MKTGAKKYGLKAVDLFLRVVEPMAGKFFTFQTRPMYASEIWYDPRETIRDYSEYAIVMQGPIRKVNNFTLETLKIYKKYFKNALIILSTWEGEDAYTIEGARAIGVEVILNEVPAIPGHLNINMQGTTAMAGLRFAAMQKKKYALKTRTDQRIYNNKSFTYMTNLLKVFPITASGLQQTGRIIALNAYDYNTKPKLYHVCNNFIFGHTEDVLLYFGAAHISMNPPGMEFLKKDYPETPFTAEIYWFTEFLKRVGHTLECTLEDYEQALATHCILVDPRLLGWYWHKYKRFFEFQLMNMSYRDKSDLGFVEWFNLYSHYTHDKKSNCCKAR